MTLDHLVRSTAISSRALPTRGYPFRVLMPLGLA